jgi:diaminopimelate epimerase
MPQVEIKKYIGGCCSNTFVVFDCRGCGAHNVPKIDYCVEYIKKYNVDSALVITSEKGFDAHLEIFERDGSRSESCGNGLILIAYLLKIKKGLIKFANTIFTVDGGLETHIVSISMDSIEKKEIDPGGKCLFVKAGEPHLIYFVDDVSKFDLVSVGKERQKEYSGGVNVDAIQKVDEFHYLIRTYERGVFAETKSCGTGSLSSFFAIYHNNAKMKDQSVDFCSAGGNHWVSMEGKTLSLEVLEEFCYVESLE